MAPRPEYSGTLEEVRGRFDKCRGQHDAFVRHYERGERAYRGVLSVASDAAKWRHKYAPPYAFNLLETVVANNVEMGLRLIAKPSPKSGISHEEAQKLVMQADVVEAVIRQEHRIDEMDLKQRPFYLTAAIGGRGVMKSYWNYETGPHRKQGVTMHEHQDAYGNTFHAPMMTEVEVQGVISDHSTTEVVDPRDFIVHESARDLNPRKPGGAQYLFHRCWYSYDQLQVLAASGFFDQKAVDSLADTRDYTEDEHYDRERQVFNANRRKDLIEVLEYWKYDKGIVRRAYVGNRAVVLREMEDDPFWHGSYPFVIGSSMPMPFSTIGMSDIELIADIQEMLWEIGNQRFDNTELVNNAVFLISGSVMDLNSFEWYPGARWEVEDVNNSVKPLEVPYQLITATLETEALLKGDLQNITSAAPFSSGTQTATVDQKTATGASIVMNAAQGALAAKKFQAQQAMRQEANMRLKNCQQFFNPQYTLHVIGKSGADIFNEIDALDIQGEFDFALTPMGESDVRQEKRAEANTVLQQMQQLYPTAYVSGTPIDMQQVIKWWARQWDIEDEVAAFFQENQQPDPGIAALLMGNAPHVQLRGMLDPGQTGAAAGEVGIAGPQPGGMPAQPGGTNMGVTSQTAVDASQPSATGGLSMSPQVMMQRALAMQGGMKK